MLGVGWGARQGGARGRGHGRIASPPPSLCPTHSSSLSPYAHALPFPPKPPDIRPSTDRCCHVSAGCLLTPTPSPPPDTHKPHKPAHPAILPLTFNSCACWCVCSHNSPPTPTHLYTMCCPPTHLYNMCLPPPPHTQIVIVMCLLVRVLTLWPALAGLGMTVAIIPLTLLLGRLMTAARRESVAAADARIKLTTEVITG